MSNKTTKYGKAKEKFILRKMYELGCGRRKATGLWDKSDERRELVFGRLMKMDTSKPTPFESNFRDSDDAGSPF